MTGKIWELPMWIFETDTHIVVLLVSDADRDLSEMSFIHVVPKFRKSH